MKRSPILVGLLSAIIPGLGQALVGQRYRGLVIFAGTVLLAATVAWYGVALWWSVPAIIWLWNVWDAASLAVSGQARSPLIPILASLIAIYGIGWQVMQIDLGAADLNRAQAIVRPMFRPDFVESRTDSRSGWVAVEVPCGPNPPKAQNTVEGITASATSDCAALGETFIVTVSGLWPDTDTNIVWVTPIGDPKMIGEGEAKMLVVRADATGALTAAVKVPSTALTAAPDPTLPQLHRVYFEQTRPTTGFGLSFRFTANDCQVEFGSLQLSRNGCFVVKGIAETLALALMATTLSIFAAVPLSFLAARNLMGGNPVTLVIYLAVRTLLNVIRSIESLIVAIVFVVIVGLGPFAGVIALTIHSVAALAKLYSEVIEGIDPGPIEAIRATGADWLQVVRYGVVPQVVPPFTAFTIYRWDINVRTSTIIGFVGGGGIGLYLIQWINNSDLRAVSSAFIAIGLVVMALDYFSARVRERLI